MPFGILDTSFLDLAPGIDVAYIQGLRTRAGVQFPQVLTEIDSRLAAFNSSIDALVAMLMAQPTEEITSEEIRPVAFKFEEASEYTIARPQFTEGQAIPLPLRKYDAGMGFTEEGLQTMSVKRILQQVDSILLGLQTLRRMKVMERLFSDAEVRVDVKTTMTSPGFAGSGTGTNAFVGPYPDGKPLPNGYTHYVRDTAANRAAAIKAQRDKLKKWYQGPFDLIASQSEIDAIAADSTNFVSAGSELIRQGSGASEAQVDPNVYVGVFDKDIRVHKAVMDFTDANICIFKSFGSLNEQNPLIWRYDPLFGRDAYVKSRSLFPLDNAEVIYRFGIGVNNRVAATLIRIGNSGSYVAPTLG